MKIEIVHPSHPRVSSCLERIFKEPVDPTRVESAKAALMGTDHEGRTVAAGIIEKDFLPDCHDGLYLWLFGVDEAFRQRGFGSLLLTAIERFAHDQQANVLRARTYQHWHAMRIMLERKGWTLMGAAASDRHDCVAEDWCRPIIKSPLRLIVIGTNPSGQGGEWIEAIRSMPEEIKLVGLCDKNPLHIPPGIKADTDTEWSHLINRTPADAAVIALPHNAYREPRAACIEAGMAILHEKPLACTLAELMELQKTLEKSKVPIVTGVQRRAHPSYIYLKNQIDQQKEKPGCLVVKMTLGRSEPAQGWRSCRSIAGGGALIDLGYHAVDLVHFLLQAPLEIIHIGLRNGKRPAMQNEIETGAIITGRCGNIWIKVLIDRGGRTKAEQVSVHYKDCFWTACRDHVACSGQVEYECKGSWDAAKRGCLTRLILAANAPAPVSDLWEHLSAMQVIENAYARVSYVEQKIVI